MVAINFKVLFERVLELLLAPGPTWKAILKEPDAGRALMARYPTLLALLPALAGLLGSIFSGQGLLLAVVQAVLRFGITLGSVWALAYLLNRMAPVFGTVRAENAAFKLAAYASTPLWVAGLLTVVPQLLPLSVVAGFGYSAYLLHGGCQILMETPREKAWPYTLAAVGAWFLLVLVASSIVFQAVSLFTAPAPGAPPPAPPRP